MTSASDEEHDEAEYQVQRTDVLVVGRKQPAPDAFFRAVMLVVCVLRLCDCCCHTVSLRSRAVKRRICIFVYWLVATRSPVCW
jgi:hypothetical protein